MGEEGRGGEGKEREGGREGIPLPRNPRSATAYSHNPRCSSPHTQVDLQSKHSRRMVVVQSNCCVMGVKRWSN